MLHWLTGLFRRQPWHWILPIKGSFYYDADLAEASGWLIAGCALQLKCEPDNIHDQNAVQIFVPLLHRDQAALVGYIPYRHSLAVSKLLKHPEIAPNLKTTLFNGYRQYQRLHLFVEIQASLTLWQRLRLNLSIRPPKKL